jgi:hypothetical protein
VRGFAADTVSQEPCRSVAMNAKHNQETLYVSESFRLPLVDARISRVADVQFATSSRSGGPVARGVALGKTSVRTTAYGQPSRFGYTQ